MKLKGVSDVIWQYYQEGRAKVTAQTFDRRDIAAMVKFGYADAIRQQYIESRKRGDGNDYSFFSSVLSIKKFKLSDANATGRRIADLGDADMFSLPKNAHITNVYPVGECDDGETITQVSPGEENFYITPEFDFYKFFCVKGKAIHTYHLPECVNEIEVEATHDIGDETDIPQDIAFNVANVILGVNLKLKGFPIKIIDNYYDPQATELKRRITEQEERL